MLDSFNIISELITNGNLKPGNPRFDGSQLFDVQITDSDATFLFNNPDPSVPVKSLRIPLNDLTMDEARIAYKIIFNKEDPTEEATKHLWGPRPWKRTRSDMNSSFYVSSGIFIVVLILIVIGIVGTAISEHRDVDPNSYLGHAIDLVKNSTEMKDIINAPNTHVTYDANPIDPSDYGYTDKKMTF